MCTVASPCLVHGGCKDNGRECIHISRSSQYLTHEQCYTCSSTNCNYEVGDFIDMGESI